MGWDAAMKYYGENGVNNEITHLVDWIVEYIYWDSYTGMEYVYWNGEMDLRTA